MENRRLVFYSGGAEVELEKMKSVFPDFKIEHFSMFHTITSLKWENIYECQSGEGHRNLFLTMVCSEGYKILLEFTDVDSLCLRGNGQIAGFYIKDMSERGYERGSKYEIGDYEENDIAFYCSNVVVKELVKFQHIGLR